MWLSIDQTAGFLNCWGTAEKQKWGLRLTEIGLRGHRGTPASNVRPRDLERPLPLCLRSDMRPLPLSSGPAG